MTVYPPLSEMQEEVEQRVASLSEPERRKVTYLLLTMLRCFGEMSTNEVAIITADNGHMEISSVNSPAPNTVSIVATAYALLSENYGVTAVHDPKHGYLQ
jgi:hypothetical protein